MIIVDVGACVGEFTDDCLQKYSIDAIYLFEPLLANFNSLVKKYQGNDKVHLHHAAISNFDGEAQFYKKGYKQKNGEILYDFPGNVGSSLKKDKSNVSKTVFEKVNVFKLSTFLKKENIIHIDILKLDTEGSEYDIIEDILDNKLYEVIDKIYYEDHARKVAGIREKKMKMINKVRDLGILGKFYLQSGILNYTPAIKHWSKPS